MHTNPLVNFLNGGRITAFLLITQYRPTLTEAKSPRIIHPSCTIVCNEITKIIKRTKLTPEK
ncbi:hypothetical protein DERP_007405 [Dermatophagoides pteronyssinus]|uniref:Uncharacterized protein n=1 Tax=Dermatophagoides pteronyssinus TaxID=6956 RepID=A0ABQ8J4H2_DERPT|nr:hypothetical protein DERP_007405 [Dermatophagoides pteronyssinus]